MSNLFNKANTFYFVASSLATLTLLTSLALTVTSNVPLPLILALAALSVLILALLYKIIRKQNLESKIERLNEEIDQLKEEQTVTQQELNQKARELVARTQELAGKMNELCNTKQQLNKITLAKEAANKEVEKLKHELAQEKQDLDRRIKISDQKINELEAERESLLEEKESLEQKLEAKINRVFEITGKLEKIMKEKDELSEQEEKLKLEISCLKKQLEERSGFIAKLKLEMKIDNNKHAELKNEELHKEIEKLSKKKHILYNKKEELYKRQKELYVELDELQCRFKEINQKNKNLSQELKKKFEELNKANGLIENQSFELDEIRKDYDNKVKKLQNLLLGKDSQIAQLEEDLKEIVSLIQRAIQHIAREVEKPIRRSRDNNIEAVLKKVSGEIQVIKSLLKELKETAVQHLSEPVKDSKCESPSDETPASSLEDLVYASSPNETSVPLHAGDPGYESEGDSGYGLPNSCLSTPTKLPISPWAERCRRSQFRNVELVKCDD